MDMLIVDGSAGVSGDMLLCALVQAAGKGAEQKIAGICGQFGALVEFSEVRLNGIRAKKLDAKFDSENTMQPIEMIEAIFGLHGASRFVKEKAIQTVKEIGKVEEKVHGQAYFQELAELDTLVNLVGTAIAMEELGEREFFVKNLRVGKKLGHAAKGLLDGMEYETAEIEHELVTPTGAGLIRVFGKNNVAETGKEKLIGAGAGNASFKFADVLKVYRVG